MILDNISRIVIYFNTNLAVYWDKITPCAINDKPRELSRYPLDFKCKYYYKHFDREGIPVIKGKGNQYHPTVICQYALGVYELLYRSNYQVKDLQSNFLKQADWLIKNVSTIDESAGWIYNSEMKEFNISGPWYSALTQGEGISVLLRAYLLNGDKNYLDTAEKVMNLFTVPVQKGGILNYLNGLPVYEEYPSQKVNFVLNGFIFSLFGLYDFILINGNHVAKKLFAEGIETIIKYLPRFDTGDWSQYNLYSSPETYLASCKYHLLHIEMLKALYYLTGRNELLLFSNKFMNYSLHLNDRISALIKKIKS